MSKHFLKNSRVTLLVLVLSMNMEASYGGITLISHNLGRCDSYKNNPNYIVQEESSAATITPNGDGSTGYTRIYTYKVWASWMDPSQYTPEICDEFISIRYNNNPNGPEIPQTQHEINMFILLERMRNRIRNMPRPKELDGEKQHWHIRTPAAVCGVRGSLDSQTQGLDLLEASPDGLVFQEGLTDADVQSGRYVYFEVERKGDEDWLEMKVNNQVFYKRQLANFETNQIYEVEVPSALLFVGTNTWSYFLNSTGAPNSSIFFPMSSKADSDAWCGKIVATTNAVQLEFAKLVIGFNYVVEQSHNLQSNWMGVASFTATNNIQNVTVPITNSVMFYRVALPVP